MLAGAGVAFEVDTADLDEPTFKAGFSGSLAEMAQALAAAKALAVSRRRPGDLVIGGDQTLAFDGAAVSKARSMDEARERLKAMAGRRHRLHSSGALARDGVVLWSAVDTADMMMRSFSDAFLDAYLAAEGEALLACVGGYRLEGLGAQLFERVEGDYFTVLGLPLWWVLEALRTHGALPQ